VLGIAMAVAGPLTNALGARWVWGVGAISYGVAFMAAAVLAPSTRNAGPGVEEAVVSARDQPAMAPAGALPDD
jgi:hypothetical protein